jgi:hypothetical protein
MYTKENFVESERVEKVVPQITSAASGHSSDQVQPQCFTRSVEFVRASLILRIAFVACDNLLTQRYRRDLIRVRLDLETISRTSSHESEDQANFRLQVAQEVAQYHSTLAQSVDQSVQRVDQRINRIEELLMAQAISIDRSQFPGSMPEIQSTAVAIRQRPRKVASPSTTEKLASEAPAVGVRVRKNIGPVCRLNCTCTCHLERTSNTPGYFDGILGRLFVGYSGLPLFNSRCDVDKCQRSQSPSVSAEYWFPLGFCWSQIIRLELGYQSQAGPQFGLTTLRRVPDSAQCVKFALEGDIDGLKGLFQHGMASPRDVSSTRGYSLLRVSRQLYIFGTLAYRIFSGLSMDSNTRLVAFSSPRAQIQIISKLCYPRNKGRCLQC